MKAIVEIDIPTDYTDEYKQWVIDGRLCYLEDGAWTVLKEDEFKVEPCRDAIQIDLRVPSNEVVKAVENSVIDALYTQPTVNAISINWIKNVWLKKLENKEKIVFPLIFEIVMNWLIPDWEKENE